MTLCDMGSAREKHWISQGDIDGSVLSEIEIIRQGVASYRDHPRAREMILKVRMYLSGNPVVAVVDNQGSGPP
ncbi:MAG: hypothetical protein JXA13_06570 [Anaerolineales bacterium]|nr:hypothetical protein [Anaerolineales bacterium]